MDFAFAVSVSFDNLRPIGKSIEGADISDASLPLRQRGKDRMGADFGFSVRPEPVEGFLGELGKRFVRGALAPLERRT